MKELTEEDFNALKKYAEAFMSPNKVALLLEVDPDALLRCLADRNTKIHRVYFAGLYRTELSIRESIISLAIAGSSPAQMATLSMIEQCKMEATI